MRYPVDVMPCSCGFLAFCPLIPEAEGHGETRESAIQACHDAVIASFETFFTQRQMIPLPSESGADFIEIASSVVAKVLLLNAVLEHGISNTELANRLGLSRQEISRIFNLNHTTKIDTIQKALAVLDRQLLLIVL